MVGIVKGLALAAGPFAPLATLLIDGLVARVVVSLVCGFVVSPSFGDRTGYLLVQVGSRIPLRSLVGGKVGVVGRGALIVMVDDGRIQWHLGHLLGVWLKCSGAFSRPR